MATKTTAGKNLAEILLEEGRHAPKDSILARLVNSLQEIAQAVRKPISLLPSAQDIVEYIKKNFDEEIQNATAAVLQRAVDEGEVTGQIWIAMIHALRRSADRDLLTRDARHAGLKKLLFTDEMGLQRYELYIPILLLVTDERPVFGKDGEPVWDEKRGKFKTERFYVLPGGTTPADLAKKGTRLPVWKPPEGLKQDVVVNGQQVKIWVKAEAFANGLPKDDRVPPVQVTLAREDARKIGAGTTCVFYMLWAELIRIAPTLVLNKRWEEGLPDKVRNRTFNMADDVDKIVPDVGPGLGFVGAHNLAYKYVGMIMTSIMRPNGGLFTTIPEKNQLCDPSNESFVFGQALTHTFAEHTFPGGWRHCFLWGMSDGRWWLLSPVTNPLTGEYRTMIIDPRRGFLRLCIEFIWVMGWGDPGSQRDFNALVRFKKAVIDGMRDIASQISDWQIDYAARRPGVKAEEEKKDVDARYDQTGKDKTWCHREFWLGYLTARYNKISERREKEFEAMAAADTLTINVVDEEFNKGFLWRHLQDAERRARFVRIYRLADEVVERVKILPAIERETFGRRSAEDLVGKELYEHLPQPEKDVKIGGVLVRGDVGDLGPYMDQTLHVNARVAKSFGLVDKGFACYPTEWMPRPVQDWLRNLLMEIGWRDFVEMDAIVGPAAKFFGVGFARDEKVNALQNFVLGKVLNSGGPVDVVDTLVEVFGERVAEVLETERSLGEGKIMKAQAERWWRAMAWSRYYLMDHILARFGVEANLANRWLRIMEVDDPVMAAEAKESILLYGLKEVKGKQNDDYKAAFEPQEVEKVIDQKFSSWGV